MGFISRLRLRFSLLSIITLMLLAGMALTIWRLNSDVSALRTEVLRLREEAGVPTVDEAHHESIHFITLKTSHLLSGDSFNWSWRVYLPPGKDFLLGAAVGELPALGQPPGEHIERFPTTTSRAKYRQEHVVEASVSIYRDMQGRTVLRQKFGNVTMQRFLSSEEVNILATFNSVSSSHGGTRGEGKTFRGETGKPLVLLRESLQQRGTPAVLPQGIVIWIESLDGSDQNLP